MHDLEPNGNGEMTFEIEWGTKSKCNRNSDACTMQICTSEEWLWIMNHAKTKCKMSLTQEQVDMLE